MDHHAEVFKEEAYELLTELETSLLELDEKPHDMDVIDRIFRSMHTIKGSSSMFGFADIAEFTHDIENAYDKVRNGDIPVTKELINITLIARDHIKAMLDVYGKPDQAVDPAISGNILVSLKQIMAEMPPIQNAEKIADTETDPLNQEPGEEGAANNISYWIRFRPPKNLFLTGTNPANLLNELRGLGDCEIIAQLDELPLLKDLNPEECYTYWDIILTTTRGVNTIKDVFIFVQDESDVKIEVIDEENLLESEVHYKKLGEILIKHGDLRQQDLDEILGKQKRLGEMLLDEGLVDAGKIHSALAEQQHVQQKRKEHSKAETSASIRVASEKLDQLVDLIGELVTVQSRLSQLSGATNEPELLAVSEEVERLTTELRDNTMSIRMLPIGTTFGKFKRLVHDLSNELGKKIDLVTEGAETELDKTVIERLNDPLVHLIRNCIDHGIETPDVREKMGKPATGSVQLSAIHSGAHVLIRIMDDGKGLDCEAIRAKAVEKNIIQEDADLPENEIFSLILHPGFSTAQKITSVSGRGVGLDVVQQAIENLSGSIDIKSEKNVGTTITLKLPLTLAIIEGLLVKVENDYFVIPLLAVEECVELCEGDTANTNNRKVANVRGEIIPYIHLREHFGVPGESPNIEQIVIVKIEDKKVGFVVDAVVGEHQTVLKSLGKIYSCIQDISGATILGDGTVALIIDLMKLFITAEEDEITTISKNHKRQMTEPDKPLTEYALVN